MNIEEAPEQRRFISRTEIWYDVRMERDRSYIALPPIVGVIIFQLKERTKMKVVKVKVKVNLKMVVAMAVIIHLHWETGVPVILGNS